MRACVSVGADSFSRDYGIQSFVSLGYGRVTECESFLIDDYGITPFLEFVAGWITVE